MLAISLATNVEFHECPLDLMTVRYTSDIIKGPTLRTKDGLIFSTKLASFRVQAQVSDIHHY